MTTSTITIDRLAAAELDEAGAVLDAAFAGRDMVKNLRMAYGLQPESWFCARAEGRIVGMVGAYDYGPVASIGMMGVHPSVQRQQVGERLMIVLVAYLEGRGCPLLFLDASAAGQHLYPKLGFVGDGETVKMTREEPASQKAARDASPPAAGDERTSGDTPVVRRLEEADLAEVAAFDAPLFGAGRTAVIRAFWRGSDGRAFVARDAGGQVTGYLIAGGNHIGPWVAATPATAGRLLDAALALPFDAPPFLTCPTSNAAGMALLARHGFAVTQHWLHMRRGGERDPRQTDYLYAAASVSLG